MTELTVDGVLNVRSTGGPVPWLVRSAAPENLTGAGAAALREYGITCVVDLREPEERGSVLHELPVRHVALYGAPPPTSGRLEDIYETLLRTRGSRLAEAVAVIADARGGVLVHCTAGKDRTGLVVALARLAAGASVSDVVKDYVPSGEAIAQARAAYAERAAATVAAAERADVLRLHLQSPADAIRHAIDVVDELGGPGRYLLSHGVTAAQLRALRQKGRAA